MASFDNRLTRFDLLALTRAKSPTKSPKAVSYDSLPSTPNDNAFNKNRGYPSISNTTTRTGKTTLKSAGAVTSSSLLLRVARESPWVRYEKVYNVELGGTAEVAVRKAPPTELVHIRNFTTHTSAKTLHLFRQLQHRNIVTALEAFTTETSLHIVLEHMPISLERIVRSPAYPNDQQLAAILGQVLAGVAYIASEGYEHGSLTCSNILLSTDGDVKIANQESCQVIPDPKSKSHDIRALSFITMELMQKYVKEGGAIGIDNPHRWSSNSDALGFLSATESVASAEELLKHPLFSRPYQKGCLVGIISLAQVCMRGDYKYTSPE